MREPMRVLVSTGHLGFTPIERASFEAGVARIPAVYINDSGSCDIGPYPLGSDGPHSPAKWQRHDLELLLLASRRQGVPMIIGSASDTGTNRGVDAFARMIRDIAREHRLPPFRMARIYSELSKDLLRDVLRRSRIEGLGGRPDLSPEVLDRTDRVVAMMGAEPIIEAMDRGADVVIAGRSCDDAIFAAPVMRAGYPRPLAWLVGKVMECASFCGEPYMAKESILGSVDEEGATFEPMHPAQRCTPSSIASHCMYERESPYRHAVPGGELDLTECRFIPIDDRRTRVTGAKFIASPTTKVKLEGAGWVGERAVSFAGIRDPLSIQNIGIILKWSKQKVAERLGEPGESSYRLYFRVFGRDGVMGEWEPRQAIASHELGIMVEAVASVWEVAEEACHLAMRNLFYARYPGVKGTAGGAAFAIEEVFRAKPAYSWTINHLLEVEEGMELFPVTLEGVSA